MKRFALAISLALLAQFISPSAYAATTLSNTATSNPIFVEDGAEVLIGEGITFTGEQSFSGGYLEFSVGSSATADILNLQKVSTAVVTNGVVSVVGSTIYKGDGTNANPVASIDSTYDGTAGKNLRIRFSSAFVNAGFETGDFTGWEYINTRIDIGVTTLAGVVSSDASNSYPNTCSGSSLNDNDAPQAANYYYEFSTAQKTEGSKSLRLYSTMTTANGGDIVHGPAVVSSEFTAASGDTISFDWIAAAGGDDFDAYGYLINSATGAQIEVIDANGSGTTWATKNTTIPATGNYRFVFINGTHDLSCGRAAGGSLYIDNIKVVGQSVTAALAESIARLVTYKSTSNNPASSKTVTLTAVPASGSITPLNLTVDITAVDDGPVPADITISITDTTATDDFSNATGTISANDPDGASGGGTVVYGISGGTVTTGVSSKTGNYGVLSVDESSGAYTFAPDDNAINAAIINVSDTFTITATSGALVGSASLAVNITAAAESATTAPAITSLTPIRGPIAGGTVVTLTGTGFSTAQFVKFGTTYGTNLTIVSDTSLTVEAPSKLAGSYNVTILNNGGTNSGTNNYTYYIPSAPLAPTSPSATAGNQSAAVSWTAAADATSYVVTSTPGSFTCTTSSTSCTVSGLTNGTAYTFTVIARNATGNSSASSATSSVTPNLPAPGTPTNPSATAGDSAATVSWTASSNAASYVVTSSPGSFTCTTSGNSCTVSGLTNGTAYTFSVIARNATGDSSPTSATISVTPTAASPAVSSIAPSTGTSAGGTVVTITGLRFTGATGVTFGGTPGTSLSVVSDTSISIVSPAGTAGSAIIVVTTASGSDTDGVTFTYTEPPRRTQPSQETLTAQNQALANKITVTSQNASGNSPQGASGPIKINGLSKTADIYVAPSELPKIPGFSSLKVNNNSIEVVSEEKFSGKMLVPVTISENGATVTLNISVVVNPKPVVEAQSTPVDSKTTGVVWEISPNAVSYKVQLNGKALCSSTGNTCSVPKLLGPKAKLEVVSLGNDGTKSTQVIPAYTPSKPVPVLDVNFGSGSASITAKEITKLKTFVKLMNEQGFTSVAIDAFTDGTGNPANAKGLATARAKAVARYLDRYLNVKLTTSGKGISPIATGENIASPKARKAQVSVL